MYKPPFFAAPWAAALPGLFALGLALGSALTLTACHPDGPTDIDEFDVVGTARDLDADFKPLRTYARRDSIRAIDETDDEPVEIDLPQEITDAILNAIDLNMCALGYTRIPVNVVPPDFDSHVVIEVGAVETITYALFTVYPFWGGGYGGAGFWGGGWGGRVPWPRIRVAELPTGTLIIDMVYPAGADPNDPDKLIPVFWQGIVNGLLRDEGMDAVRIAGAVDQAYYQSPYLATSAGDVCP